MTPHTPGPKFYGFHSLDVSDFPLFLTLSTPNSISTIFLYNDEEPIESSISARNDASNGTAIQVTKIPNNTILLYLSYNENLESFEVISDFTLTPQDIGSLGPFLTTKANKASWKRLTKNIYLSTLKRFLIPLNNILSPEIAIEFPKVPHRKQIVQEYRNGKDKNSPYISLFKDSKKITALSFDNSPIFNMFLDIHFHGQFGLFLGAFELSFILTLFEGNMSAWTFWKEAFVLISNCDLGVWGQCRELLEAVVEQVKLSAEVEFVARSSCRILSWAKGHKNLLIQSMELGELIEENNTELDEGTCVSMSTKNPTTPKEQYIEETRVGNATTKFSSTFQQKRMRWLIEE
eukprot:snap_masked-scaffold_18-processed-gene-2.44-mRNA-1 protein AED:1.00 eAED:1.00 QI:0/-1/0/0/-1/1/1/0/347